MYRTAKPFTFVIPNRFSGEESAFANLFRNQLNVPCCELLFGNETRMLQAELISNHTCTMVR